MRLLPSLTLLAACLAAHAQPAADTYVPTAECEASRQAFSDTRLGIFIHWGLYAIYGQGEWYMQNAGIDRHEYAKAADAFYPHRFDADKWAEAIKDAGAGYITLTSRHHDGFSLWRSDASNYNSYDATPFHRDIVGELAEACHKQNLRLHLYYSLLDWSRDDYPMGRTGRHVGKDSARADWASYRAFMDSQLTELLTRYGPIGAIWFDGMWDHDSDATPFDWQLASQYALIHRLQPACLVGNNHHIGVLPGEDIQIFERDLPGENKAGFVDKAAKVSPLPLETCQTMNGMWGYKVADTAYKTADELIALLASTAGRGANLLLNIGPQPNGELPEAALDRLKALGSWMRIYGETIRRTHAGPLPPSDWGATTQRADTTFVHILDRQTRELALPRNVKVRYASDYATGAKLPVKRTKTASIIALPPHDTQPDYVISIKN